LQRKREQYPSIAINHLSNDDLWEITRNLSIEQRNEILGLPPSSTAIVKQTLALLINKQEHETKWRGICQKLLVHWKGLTTNVLTSPNGVRLDLDEIFVPLGMVSDDNNQNTTPMTALHNRANASYNLLIDQRDRYSTSALLWSQERRGV
jgi:hypothetical protein